MRRRREMVQARRNCKPSLETFQAQKVSSTEPVVPEVFVANSEPSDRYSELLRLYRVEGGDAVRREFTVEELRKLSRIHGFDIRSSRTKAQIIEMMLG